MNKTFLNAMTYRYIRLKFRSSRLHNILMHPDKLQEYDLFIYKVLLMLINANCSIR